MAIDIYFISAISSKPKRVFSRAKYIILDLRGSLKSKTIELLKCLKLWFRLGIFTKENLHVVDDDIKEIAAEILED